MGQHEEQQHAPHLAAVGRPVALERVLLERVAVPTNTFTQRFAGAYGRMSHARSVLSCAHRCTALLKPLTSMRLPEIEATS